MQHKRYLVALLIVLAALLAGCGSDGGADTAVTTAAPKSAPDAGSTYVEQADAICKQANEAMEPYEAEVEGTEDVGVIVSAMHQVLRVGDDEAKELANLTVPVSEVDARTELLHEKNAQLETAHEAATALEHQDIATFKADGETIKAQQERLKEISSKYGYKVCGVK